MYPFTVQQPSGLLQLLEQAASTRQKTFTNSAGGSPGQGGPAVKQVAFVVGCEISARAKNKSAIPANSRSECSIVRSDLFIDARSFSILDGRY